VVGRVEVVMEEVVVEGGAGWVLAVMEATTAVGGAAMVGLAVVDGSVAVVGSWGRALGEGLGEKHGFSWQATEVPALRK
jgi:hypothetical protein